MIKTLFFTGARVDEFINFNVEDLHFESDPPLMMALEVSPARAELAEMLVNLYPVVANTRI